LPALRVPTVAALAFFLSCLCSAQDEGVALRYAPAADRTDQYKIRLDGTVRIGRSAKMPVEAEYYLSLRVESVDAEAATRTIRTLFGPGRVALNDKLLPWTLEGKAYATVRDSSGRVADVRSHAPVPDPRSGDFAALFHDLGFGTIMPPDPVHVGDTWDVDITEEPLIFEPTAEEKKDREVEGRFSARLADWRTVADLPVADVEFRNSLKASSAAGAVTSRCEMKTTLDGTDGWLLKAEGKFSMVIQPADGERTLFEDVTVITERVIEPPKAEGNDAEHE